jgi:hypothetical protein
LIHKLVKTAPAGAVFYGATERLRPLNPALNAIAARYTQADDSPAHSALPTLTGAPHQTESPFWIKLPFLIDVKANWHKSSSAGASP